MQGLEPISTEIVTGAKKSLENAIEALRLIKAGLLQGAKGDIIAI